MFFFSNWQQIQLHILRDPEFIVENMPVLREFYFNFYLPLQLSLKPVTTTSPSQYGVVSLLLRHINALCHQCMGATLWITGYLKY